MNPISGSRAFVTGFILVACFFLFFSQSAPFSLTDTSWMTKQQATPVTYPTPILVLIPPPSGTQPVQQTGILLTNNVSEQDTFLPTAKHIIGRPINTISISKDALQSALRQGLRPIVVVSEVAWSTPEHTLKVEYSAYIWDTSRSDTIQDTLDSLNHSTFFTIVLENPASSIKRDSETLVSVFCDIAAVNHVKITNGKCPHR